jgi:hypothetical protein
LIENEGPDDTFIKLIENEGPDDTFIKFILHMQSSKLVFGLCFTRCHSTFWVHFQICPSPTSYLGRPEQ